jgi:alkylation response protein AidB-like acyl-CoA dehydrogenase
MKKLKEFTNQVAETIFSADQGFQDHLKDLLSEKDCEQLHTTLKKWEAKIPGWEKLATEASRPEKLPRVQKYDEVGNRVEDIILPIETKTIKREVVETGIFEGNTEVEKFAKIYLLAQIGESGVTCPLACTDGLIRSIEALGSDFLKEKYLPLLSSVEEPIAGAQFITEQTGGSDVGAIEGTAKQNGDHWLLTAEKWY